MTADTTCGSGNVAAELLVRSVMSKPEFAARFKHPVRFDGVDFREARLSEDEQRMQLLGLASSQLHIFLERYGNLLSKVDLAAIGNGLQGDTPEVRYWLDRLLQQPASQAVQQKRARRRRYKWAQTEVDRSDGFFSEEAMRRRQPALWQQMVGRHIQQLGHQAGGSAGFGICGASSMSAFLVDQLDKQVEADAEKEVQAAARARGDEEADIFEDEEHEEEFEPDACDVAAKRARFLDIMRDRFINGKESSDYQRIDEDSDLDDMEVEGRDLEERYFDADDDDDDDI